MGLLSRTCLWNVMFKSDTLAAAIYLGLYFHLMLEYLHTSVLIDHTMIEPFNSVCATQL